MYLRLLCKVIQDSLDSGFYAVNFGFQALAITLLNELTNPAQAKMSRIQIPDQLYVGGIQVLIISRDVQVA